MKEKKFLSSPTGKNPLPQNLASTEQIDWENYAGLPGCTIMILLGVLLYSNSFNCGFHLDDSGTIVNNATIRDLFDVSAWGNFNTGRPVAIFSFALNYYFNQLDVWNWHLVNLGIHLINTGLVYWLTLLIYVSPVMKDAPTFKHKKVIALATALLFVSHPLATESVTYIVQRMASMSAMFYLFSLTLYIQARLNTNNNLSRYLLYAGSLCSAILAMFTKENALTLPIAIVLFEICFLQENKVSINIRSKRVILLLTAFLGITVLALLKYPQSIFNPIPPSDVTGYVSITSFNYLLTQFSVIVKYIWLLILPANQNLDYDYHLSNSFFEFGTLLSFVLLLSLFILGIFLFKKYRVISFGIFWFFLTLSVESSVIPISDLIFEHRTYLPSVGFFLILSSGIFFSLWDNYKNFAIIILLLIIGSNSFLTFKRNKVWQDEVTLWSDVIKKSPKKARGYNNRGNAYILDNKNKEAIEDFNKAIQLQPKNEYGYYNRGTALMNSKKYDQALKDFNKSIELQPKYAMPYNNRGYIFTQEKKYDQALNNFNTAIELEPAYVEAYYNRGNNFNVTGKYEQALIDFKKAIELRPTYLEAHINLGNTYRNLGKTNEAIEVYSKVIGIDSKFIKAYELRGSALMKENKPDEALNDFNKAIELNPSNAGGYLNRGNLHFNEQRYEEAIKNFSQAIELKKDLGSAYHNRSLAEYKSDKKTAACEDMNQAVALGYPPAKELLKQICQ